MERAELAAWLRLQLTPGIGNDSARRLLRAFGLPQQVFAQPAELLRTVVSERQAQALCQAPEALAAQLETTWRWLQEAPLQRRVLTLGDAAYPNALLQLEDPPLLLYGMGACAPWQSSGLQDYDATRAVAVVGSRNPTPQGSANARQFAQALAQAGLTIVSGMALGVDGAAHEGALLGAGQEMATIAVVGTGLDRVYPRQHRALAHRILERGLLLSEYALGTPPLPANFPRRNRILAGLSAATLVVEAALQSGSLITARLAAEQGKDVLAIPGSIHSTQARGCHALLKQGAKLVESAQDVLDELSLPYDATKNEATNPSAMRLGALSDAQESVLEALGYDPCSLDDLLARTGLDVARLQALPLQLELDGHLARLPGALLQRSALA